MDHRREKERIPHERLSMALGAALRDATGTRMAMLPSKTTVHGYGEIAIVEVREILRRW